MESVRQTFDPNDRGPFIQTFSGGRFYYADARESEIDIRDIAHGLANNCRFNGHVKRFYSVAEHCFVGSYYVPPQHALAFLLHDANEAYLTDVPSPLKSYLDAEVGSVLRDLEARVDALIFRRYGLEYPMPPEVREADLRMLKTEVEQFMADPADYRIADIKAYDIRLEGMTPYRAESLYLARFRELT
jgi:hypothetical protein